MHSNPLSSLLCLERRSGELCCRGKALRVSHRGLPFHCRLLVDG
jgi:hypothetical protein